MNDILKIGSTVFVVQTNDIAKLKDMPIINKRIVAPNGVFQGNIMGNVQMIAEEEKSGNSSQQ